MCLLRNNTVVLQKRTARMGMFLLKGRVGFPSWGCRCCSMANGVMNSRTTPGLVGHTKYVWSEHTARVRFSLVPIVLTVSKNHANTLFNQKSRPDKTFCPHATQPYTPCRHCLMIKPLLRLEYITATMKENINPQSFETL